MNRYFTEIQHLYAPCPDCPVLCPNIYLRKPPKATCNLLQLTAGYRQVSNRKCHFLPSKCQVNAKLKTQKPTFYLRKLWKNHGFTTLNCVFTTFSNLSNLRNLISYYGNFRTTDGRRSQYQQLGDSWGAVGRKLGNRICGHLGQLVYMHVKILKPEVKALTHNYMRKNSETRGIFHTRIHAKILKPEVHVKILKPDLIKIRKPLPLKIWKPGAVKFYNFFTESY